MKKVMVKEKSVRVSPEIYFQLKELSILEGREIKFFIDRAIKNFLKIKLGNRLNKKE